MATLAVAKPSVKGGMVLDTSNKPVPVPFLGGAAITAGTIQVDDFPNPNSRTYLILYNNDVPAVPPATPVADQVVTINPLGKPDGIELKPYDVSIPAGCMAFVGPFDPTLFNNAGGSIQVVPKAYANTGRVRVSVLQT